jgi:hypothetical protein
MSNPSGAVRPVCEPLENRQLLAADLVATEIRGRLPDDLVSGTRGRLPGVAVQVQNSGDTAVSATDVVARLFASADGVLDAGDALLAENTLRRFNVGIGRGRRIPFPRLVDPIPTVAQGAYRLIAVVDATDVVPEDNPGNNSIASTGTVNIGPPFVNLTATRVFVGNFVRSGRPARLTFTVLNAGNTNARGTGVVNVLFRPASQTTGGVADNVDVRVNVRTRREGRLVGRVEVPVGLTAGQYTVIATLISVTGFTDSVTTDNTANAATTVR